MHGIAAKLVITTDKKKGSTLHRPPIMRMLRDHDEPVDTAVNT
ncbi:hypothetical protein [Nonomuraea dietziae]|uniref:Uncharacterized protein n=1 Tax=Nonomuraea dietziae TaxID=65515 RepID=A0A7W5UTX9_9ACTN|nr:hypothetical protein [Nonomuraea dietziae]MBB3724516.1 hypothetical protein [Nonomuraea dietziae]